MHELLPIIYFFPRRSGLTVGEILVSLFCLALMAQSLLNLKGSTLDKNRLLVICMNIAHKNPGHIHAQKSTGRFALIY